MTKGSGTLKRLFVGSPAGLLLMLFAGALLLSSATGLYIALRPPKKPENLVVLEHEQKGAFDYAVHLKPNELFDEPKLGPRQIMLTNLTERIDVTYSYGFSADQSVDQQLYEYQVVARFGDPDLWQKETVIVPPAMSQDPSFSVSFPVSVPEYIELAEFFREKAGTSLDPARLTLLATVRPHVMTGYGTVTEAFEHSIVFTLHGTTIRRETNLEKTTTGEITETRPAPWLAATHAQRISTLSLGGLALSLTLLFATAGLSIWVRRSTSASERELLRAQSAARGLIIRTEEVPPLADGHVTTRVQSLDDLLELAEETLRPVICTPNAVGYTYTVIDGSSGVRYVYTSRGSEGRREHSSHKAAGTARPVVDRNHDRRTAQAHAEPPDRSGTT